MRSRRLLLVFLLGAALTALVVSAQGPAATPPAGAVGPPPGPPPQSLTWQGMFYAAQSTAVPEACAPVDPLNTTCDHFSLTVQVPAGYWNTNTGGADVSISWGSSDNDFDLYVYDSNGNQVGSSATGGTTSERVFIPNAEGTYEVRVVPFLVVASGYSGAAGFVSQPGGPAPNPVRGTGGLAFSPAATVVDPQRTEGEPVNFIDKNGNYWESGPYGFSTAQSFIHRSTDGGNQFNLVSFTGLRPNAPPGGGDTDVVVDDQGDAYFVDLEGLAELSCAVSEDSGNNWTTNQICVDDTVVDRQWFSVDNGPDAGPDGNTVFLAYRQTPRGSFIYSTPGADDPDDPGGGVAYVNSSADLVNPVSTGAPCGQMRFDPVKRNLYYPCVAGDHVEITVGHVNSGQRTGITYVNRQAPLSPGGGPIGDVFPGVATDKAGNLYAVWVDETDHNVYYAASADAGQTWGPARQVNGNDTNSNGFVWAQGGAAGTLAVSWLGNSSHLDSDNMPSWYNNRQASTAYQWFGYAALIRSAVTAPTYAQTRFTDQPMHFGQICNQGLACTVSGGDRTMADYFSFYLDRDGAMRIVFNDTTSQHHGAHVFEVRQIAGPGALGGTISRSVPSNPVSDPTGDAQVPHYAPTGTGASVPQFDFTQLRLSQPTTSSLRVQMTLNGPLTGAVPPPGETNSLWLTRFQARSLGDEGEESYRILYVGAEATGPGPPTSFFAGSGDSDNNGVKNDGCVTTTPENCKIVLYPNEMPATGSVSGNTITIDVPLSGFGPGRPILGDTLYNVTALSFGRSQPPHVIPLPADPPADFLYLDIDATRAFDFPLGGGGGGGGGGGTGTGCKITGGGAIPSGIGEGKFSLNPQADRKGKVDYRDDGMGVNFRSTKLTGVRCDGNAGHVEGDGTNSGAPTGFSVDVVDNGEPGSTDVFKITLTGTGYTNAGTLTRGNIQIHN